MVLKNRERMNAQMKMPHFIINSQTLANNEEFCAMCLLIRNWLYVYFRLETFILYCLMLFTYLLNCMRYIIIYLFFFQGLREGEMSGKTSKIGSSNNSTEPLND